MKKAKKWLLFILVLTVSFTFCGKKDETQTPKPESVVKVKIGYQPTVFYTYLFLAEELGLFQNAGLDVELIRLPSANKMFQAFLAGQLDMTGLTATEIMLRGYEKDPGSFVCPLMVELNDKNIADRIIVLKDSPIMTITGLQGKKIGSHPGTTVPNILKSLLTKHGVKPESVEIQTLKPNLQFDAVLNKAVDAIICLEPTGTQLLKSGECRVLYDHPFGVIEDQFPASYAVLGKEFVKKHPEAAIKLMSVIDKAVKEYRKQMRKDRSIIDGIVSKKLGIDQDFLKSIYPVVYKLTDEWDEEAFKRINSFYKEMGVLTENISLDQIKYQAK